VENSRTRIASISDELVQAGVEVVFFDTELKNKERIGMQIGFCPCIAEHTKGRYYRLSELTAETVADAVLSSLSADCVLT
jgi:Mg-chelatase subunit ChlD